MVLNTLRQKDYYLTDCATRLSVEQDNGDTAKKKFEHRRRYSAFLGQGLFITIHVIR